MKLKHAPEYRACSNCGRNIFAGMLCYAKGCKSLCFKCGYEKSKKPRRFKWVLFAGIIASLGLVSLIN